MPHYEQRDFRSLTKTKGWYTLVSGDGRDDSIQIHQNAQISIASLENGEKLEMPKIKNNRGLLLLVVEGVLTIEGTVLERRDEIQITQIGVHTIEALDSTQVLLFDIPIIAD